MKDDNDFHNVIGSVVDCESTSVMRPAKYQSHDGGVKPSLHPSSPHPCAWLPFLSHGRERPRQRRAAAMMASLGSVTRSGSCSALAGPSRLAASARSNALTTSRPSLRCQLCRRRYLHGQSIAATASEAARGRRSALVPPPRPVPAAGYSQTPAAYSTAAPPASKSAAKAALRKQKKADAPGRAVAAGAGTSTYPPIPDGWSAVIGIECHAQIKTNRKLFSRESGWPNDRRCALCVLLPSSRQS